MAHPTTIVPARLVGHLDALLVELEVPQEFPAEVLADAEAAAAAPQLPTEDLTGVPFVTIDPPTAMDLDQAMHLERRGDGWRVRYAIADVPAFVRPGSPTDAETRRRGQTLYAPHRRVPLHPPVLGEDAGSLLPDQARPAFVWDLDVASDGSLVATAMRRAMVRSRGRYDYEQVQAAHDAGDIPEPFALLPELGQALQAAERARGGMNLGIPDQEVEDVTGEEGPDGYRLRYRPRLAVEDWNAQVSLLTGMAAGAVMVEGRVGVLRTMPEPDERTVARFRRQARAIGVADAADAPLGDLLRSLDVQDPRHLALLHGSTVLFRGAAYTVFDGEVPEGLVQAAVAASYAHVTAPLRRLVDRFGLVTCEHLLAGAEVPAWVREALPSLPELMQGSDRLSGALDRAVIDLVEAATLHGRVGEEFDAVVVDDGDGRGRGESHALVQLTEPAVLGRCSGDLEAGTSVRVRLVEADVERRVVRFEAV
jgi:exoribonuclease R